MVIKDLDIYDRVGYGVAHDEYIPFSIRNGQLKFGPHSSPFSGSLYVEFVKVCLISSAWSQWKFHKTSFSVQKFSRNTLFPCESFAKPLLPWESFAKPLLPWESIALTPFSLRKFCKIPFSLRKFCVIPFSRESFANSLFPEKVLQKPYIHLFFPLGRETRSFYGSHHNLTPILAKTFNQYESSRISAKPQQRLSE